MTSLPGDRYWADRSIRKQLSPSGAASSSVVYWFLIQTSASFELQHTKFSPRARHQRQSTMEINWNLVVGLGSLSLLLSTLTLTLFPSSLASVASAVKTNVDLSHFKPKEEMEIYKIRRNLHLLRTIPSRLLFWVRSTLARQHIAMAFD